MEQAVYISQLRRNPLAQQQCGTRGQGLRKTPGHRAGIFYTENNSKAFVVNNLMSEGVKMLNDSVLDLNEDHLENNEYYGFIFFNSFDTLKENMLFFSNSIGSFLFIIEDIMIDFDPDLLTKALHEVWKKNGALKVFVLVNEYIYHYKPFEIEEITNIRGKLNIFSEYQKVEDFSDLNGYTLNIEIFYSVYSIVKNITGVRPKFYGPDADVANFMQTKMNFTSKKINRDICFMS